MVDQEGNITKEDISQQTFTGDKIVDISSEKEVKFENQEVNAQNGLNGVTEESTLIDNDNEVD